MPGGKNKITPKDNPKPFTSENQPDPELLKAAHKRKRDLKDLADALLNNDGISKAKETAKNCGIDLHDDEFTLEVVMTLGQIQRAITKGDTQAYNAAMDRMKGKPLQKNENENKHSFEDKDAITSWLDKFSSKINPDQVEKL